MADWREVMASRSAAAEWEARCRQFEAACGDDETGQIAGAILVAAVTVCSELRALATAIDYAAVGPVGRSK